MYSAMSKRRCACVYADCMECVLHPQLRSTSVSHPPPLPPQGTAQPLLPVCAQSSHAAAAKPAFASAAPKERRAVAVRPATEAGPGGPCCLTCCLRLENCVCCSSALAVCLHYEDMISGGHSILHTMHTCRGESVGSLYLQQHARGSTSRQGPK